MEKDNNASNDSDSSVDSIELSTIDTTMGKDKSLETKKGKLAFLKFGFKNMNKNTKLILVLTAVLLLVGIITLVLMSGKNAPTTSEGEETVQEIIEEKSLGAAITLQEGTLQIQTNGAWKDVTSDQVIEEGTTLRTIGAASRSVVTFDDGSALRIDANSEIEISTITTERIVIKHNSGYTYNRVLPSSKLTYVVTTADAQYEALGTAFSTVSTGDEQSVKVFHSSVVETSTNKTPKEGEKLTIIDKTNPSTEGNITKLDIEEVKNDPFLQWNRNLDEQDENFKSTLGFMSDITSPEITLNNSDGDVVLLEPDAKEGVIEISGSTESSAKVTVLSKSQSGAQPVSVTVGDDGKFTTPVLTAPLGSSVFEFVATDRTGNKTTKTLRITFQRKSQPVAGNAVSFVLTGEKNTAINKVIINWKFSGIEAPDGVKLVYSKTEKPAYVPGGTPGVASSLIKTDTSWASYYTDLEFGNGDYYFRACLYDKNSGTCGQYSNEIMITVP